MGLIRCEGCGAEIKRKEKICPHCARPNKKHDHLNGFEAGVALVLGLAFLWWFNSPSPKSAPPATPEVRVQEELMEKKGGNFDSKEARELAGLMLNMNKLLCAEIVEIRPLRVNEKIHEITCIQYRGGSGKKVYHLDTQKGVAWEP